MKDTFNILVNTPVADEVPVSVEVDIYVGSENRRHRSAEDHALAMKDDPSEMSIVGAIVSESVVANGVTLFAKGQEFPFEQYEDAMLASVERKMRV